MLHTFSVHMYDLTGVLNRVTSFFRRRGFNTESPTVGRSERQSIPRTTIVVDIEEEKTKQVEANLYNLVNVTSVERISETVVIAHELALIKIRVAKDLRVSLPEELVRQFHARVVAHGPESLVLEAIGTSEQIDVLVEILRPCVILDIVRTGQVWMAAGLKAEPKSDGDAGRAAP